VKTGEFRALVPVSTRASQERGQAGNRVSAWITPLPIGEADVLERYRMLARTGSSYRSNHEERGANVLVETAEWATSRALEATIRWISRAHVFNLVVTNVPGPQFPLYLLDAPMLVAHPHVPLFANQGLGIALLSYCGRLDIGLVADWDVVPDPERVAHWVDASFTELADLARRVREDAGEEPASQSSTSTAPERLTAAPQAEQAVGSLGVAESRAAVAAPRVAAPPRAATPRA
jgi:hypothetical protein